MPDIFAYKKSIDQEVGPAVNAALHTPVVSVVKMKHGEINHVYKVTTERGPVIVRVFRYKDWPEKGKLAWIERALSAKKIPHAKLLHYTRSARHFPNGFMITEYIAGMNATEAVAKGLLGEDELYTLFGKLSRRIHSIHLEKYGLVHSGKGQFKNFAEAQLTRARRQLRQLEKHRVLHTDTLAQIKTMLSTNIMPLTRKLHPVLLHGDTSESNTIVTKDKEILYIDWDNAQAGIWLSDYIELSRRQKLESGWKNNPHRQILARKNFFKGYGKINLTTKEVQRVEHTLETLRQLWQMHYYYFDKKDMKKFKVAQRTFLTLLAAALPTSVKT